MSFTKKIQEHKDEGLAVLHCKFYYKSFFLNKSETIAFSIHSHRKILLFKEPDGSLHTAYSYSQHHYI